MYLILLKSPFCFQSHHWRNWEKRKVATITTYDYSPELSGVHRISTKIMINQPNIGEISGDLAPISIKLNLRTIMVKKYIQ